MSAVRTYHLTTLGCPKNEVDSDKLGGKLRADGLEPVADAESADVVVVNTCAFIDEARQESIETILDLSSRRRDGSKLIVTGCLAERYGDELASELPELDQVAGFGTHLEAGPGSMVPVTLGPTRRVPDFDLLNLPRPRSPLAVGLRQDRRGV